MNAFFRKGRDYRLVPNTIFSDGCEGRVFKYKGFNDGTYVFEGYNRQGDKVEQFIAKGSPLLDCVEPVLTGKQRKHTQRIPV